MNKCNWKVINYPSGKDDWKMFAKNNPKIFAISYKLKNEYITCLHLKTQAK